MECRGHLRAHLHRIVPAGDPKFWDPIFCGNDMEVRIAVNLKPNLVKSLGFLLVAP